MAIGLLVLLLAGAPSRASAVQSLEITGVTPSTIYNDLDTTLTITGESFTAEAQVFLGATELEVTQADPGDGRITAVVPRGMEPGEYTLSVHTTAAEASLAKAVTIKTGIGQWVSNGPFGGDVTQIVQAPAGGDDTLYPYAIYAHVRNVGLFRSSDGGESWKFVFYSGSPIGNLAMDQANPNLLYATKTGEGLYRSQDGGDTWEPIPFDFVNIFDLYLIYTARAYTTSTPDTVYAALNYSFRDFECVDACGVYKSTDAGSTWTRISEDIPNDEKITAIAFNGATLYAGAQDGQVYRSSDDGAGWTLLEVDWNGAPAATKLSNLAVQPTRGDLFWITETEEFYRCVEAEAGGEISLSCKAVDIDGAPGGDGVMDIQFNPRMGDGTDMLVSGYRPARSTDDGATWNLFSHTSRPFQSSAVAYSPSDANTVFAGNLQGFYVNPTGNLPASPWTRQVEGMTGLEPIHLVASPSQPQSVYVNTNGSGIFHSTNGGNSWTQLPNFINDEGNETTLKTPLAVDPQNDQKLLIATWQNTVMRSADGGQTWSPSDTLPLPELFPNPTFRFSFIEPVPGQPGHYLAGGHLRSVDDMDDWAAPVGALYESSDGGATWTDIYTNEDLGSIQAVDFDPADSDRIYFGTFTKDEQDHALRPALVYTPDGGETWKVSKPPETEEYAGYTEIRTLTIRPSNGMLLADGGMDILAIDPQTDTWTKYSSVEPAQAPINQLIYVPALGATPETLYAATTNGLFQSTDDGASWAPASAGLIGANVTVLDYVPSGDGTGIVYTGVAGGALASGAAGQSFRTLENSGGLVDGGVYHLTRMTTSHTIFLPSIIH